MKQVIVKHRLFFLLAMVLVFAGMLLQPMTVRAEGSSSSSSDIFLPVYPENGYDWQKSNNALANEIQNGTFTTNNSDGTVTNTLIVVGDYNIIGELKVTGKPDSTYNVNDYLAQKISKYLKVSSSDSEDRQFSTLNKPQFVSTEINQPVSLHVNFVDNDNIVGTGNFSGTLSHPEKLKEPVMADDIVRSLPTGYTLKDVDALDNQYLSNENETVNLPVRPLADNETLVKIILRITNPIGNDQILDTYFYRNLKDGDNVDVSHLIGTDVTAPEKNIYHSSDGNAMTINLSFKTDTQIALKYMDQYGKPLLLASGKTKDDDVLPEYYKLISGQISESDFEKYKQIYLNWPKIGGNNLLQKNIEQNELIKMVVTPVNLINDSLATEQHGIISNMNQLEYYFLDANKYSLFTDSTRIAGYTPLWGVTTMNFWPNNSTDEDMNGAISNFGDILNVQPQKSMNFVYNVSDINAVFNYVDEKGNKVGAHTVTGRPQIVDPADYVPSGYEIINDKKEVVVRSNPGPFTIVVKKTGDHNGGGGSNTPSDNSSSQTPASSSSSSLSSSSTSGAPEPIPDQPTPGKLQKGTVVYALKKINLYKNKDLKKSQRVVTYAKKPRINRPMFVVTHTVTGQNGRLRYAVRDVNHHSKTAGRKGYITASWQYVRPVYYQSVQRHLTVINPNGVNAYRNKNLTGKSKNYKQGSRLKVTGLVRHNLTTRYVLSNGQFVTANRKLVSLDKSKQPRQLKTKRTIYVYKDVNFQNRVKRIKPGRTLKVKKWLYSQPYSMTKFGLKRYQVAGGYVTANSRYVKTIDK